MTALYRAFDVTVAAIEKLSPAFIRVTLGGSDLADFAPEGVDQRIKLLLPNSHGTYPDVDLSSGGWYDTWRALSDAERPPMRTYTVRRAFRVAGETRLDIDFVAHGDAGPASKWVARATIGDHVKIIGPDALSDGPWGGTAWNPPAGIRHFVLAGDETAAPAIAAVLESLETGVSAQAFIEVPSAEDALDVALPTGAEITWLARGDRAHGELLCAAVLEAIPPTDDLQGRVIEVPDSPTDILWDIPDASPGMLDASATYAWIAGESGAVKTLRRHLVRDVGIHKGSVAFMGYWRRGLAES
jgi:NADPH-dependent ferric siderophore reductase